MEEYDEKINIFYNPEIDDINCCVGQINEINESISFLLDNILIDGLIFREKCDYPDLVYKGLLAIRHLSARAEELYKEFEKLINDGKVV